MPWRAGAAGYRVEGASEQPARCVLPSPLALAVICDHFGVEVAAALPPCPVLGAIQSVGPPVSPGP
eukprot:1192201-Prorocentrum_minimum.AAC.1